MTGYWIEQDKDGIKLLCFKFRRHGKFFVHRLSLETVTRILTDAQPVVLTDPKKRAKISGKIRGAHKCAV